MDKLWVGIAGGQTGSETFKLLFKSAVRQDKECGACHVSACREIEVVNIDTVKINVTVNTTTDCRLEKISVHVCVLSIYHHFFFF